MQEVLKGTNFSNIFSGLLLAGLAAGAIKAAPSAYPFPDDGSTAGQAGLSFPPVNPQTILKFPDRAVRIHISSDRGTSSPYGLP